MTDNTENVYLMRTSIFLLNLFLISHATSFSQKEDNIWRLGYYSGIDFNSGQADTFSTTQLTSVFETNAGICDSNGNLMFYTNGATIFNSNSDTLLNGDQLNPCSFTAMYGGGLPIPGADIIIRRPEHSNEYYLFHQTFENLYSVNPPTYLSNILYLSVIDMTLDSGRGAVTAMKNIHLYENDTLLPGSKSAVRHANGRDWWLITKKLLSSTFYKWLILPDTIIGPFLQGNIIGSSNYHSAGLGQACFSPQGDMYAVMYANKDFYLYDFDRCTGNLTFKLHKYFNDSSSFANGCAFSRSGRYLYVSTVYIIYQFDLLASDILASQTVVAVYDGFVSPFTTEFSQMKLAPDDKIYVCTFNGTDVLHVIEHPDSVGNACNVLQHSFYLSGFWGGSVNSLPNIPDYRLDVLVGSPCDTISQIADLERETLFQIFPNPVTENINLIFNNPSQEMALLKINNPLGNLVFEKQIRLNNQAINISNLQKGLYFLNIQLNSKNYIRKVIHF